MKYLESIQNIELVCQAFEGFPKLIFSSETILVALLRDQIKNRRIPNPSFGYFVDVCHFATE